MPPEVEIAIVCLDRFDFLPEVGRKKVAVGMQGHGIIDVESEAYVFRSSGVEIASLSHERHAFSGFQPTERHHHPHQPSTALCASVSYLMLLS